MNKRELVQFTLRGMILPMRIRHVSGPPNITYAEDELIVLSVVRNGRTWNRSFLDHHRGLGIRHFVILDNGSNDGTSEFFGGEGDVTLLRTSAPYHAYENTFKRYLANRFCSGRWCLFVDIDELFDYPRSTEVGLSDLLRYCDANGFNAVITQMLDMFDDRPLLDRDVETEDLKDRYRLYDLSKLRREPYVFSSAPGISMHRGGIRNAVFGTDNGLTKVSLFKMDGELQPFVEWHHARNARLADVSCVLLHFPFAGAFDAKVLEAVRTGRYGYLTNDEYTSYLGIIEAAPDLHLKGPNAEELKSVDQLLDNGFLVSSSRYEEWVLARN